jgi:hypothetical protein
VQRLRGLVITVTVPAPRPRHPETRLLRAIYGLCPDCDRTDEHSHACWVCGLPADDFHIHDPGSPEFMDAAESPGVPDSSDRSQPRSGVNKSLTSKRRRRVVENDEYVAFLTRAIRAFGRRVAAGDIDALADAAFLSARLDAAIKEAVTGLRARGYSWADIGRQLGVTRQAAQQRWGGDQS